MSTGLPRTLRGSVRNAVPLADEGQEAVSIPSSESLMVREAEFWATCITIGEGKARYRVAMGKWLSACVQRVLRAQSCADRDAEREQGNRHRYMFMDILLLAMEVPELESKLGPRWSELYPPAEKEEVDAMLSAVHLVEMHRDEEGNAVLSIELQRASLAEGILLSFMWPLLRFIR